MYKKLTVLLGIIVLGFSLQAQVAMGKWRTHFAYNTVTQIVQSKNKIYAVCGESISFRVSFSVFSVSTSYGLVSRMERNCLMACSET